MNRIVLLIVVLSWARYAHAQEPSNPSQLPSQGPQTPAPSPVPAPAPPPPSEEPVLQPADQGSKDPNPTTCARLDTTPGALLHMRATAANVLATPIPWSEFEITGQLIDDKDTVRALLEPTMQQLRTSLSTSTLPQVAQVAARFGYQLVSHRTQDVPTGTKLILTLAPLPLVKRVYVDVNEKLWQKLLEDEVRRRMTVRVGSYIPWEPIRRQCAMADEKRRILEFLWDEGYFDAKVETNVRIDEREADIVIDVDLKERYDVGTITISCPFGYERRKGVCTDLATNVPYRLMIPDSEIEEAFKPGETCIFGKVIKPLCFQLSEGYSRQRYQENIQKLKDKFHDRGFPGVRVVSTDPRASLDKRQKTVNPVLTIDQRRRVQVEFIGYDPDEIEKQDLDKALTFNDAGSADEVEINASARSLATFLQSKGYFDARVTYAREAVDIEAKPGTTQEGVHLDNITFFFETGEKRRVAKVEFVGNRAIKTPVLENLVQTKPHSFGNEVFGTIVEATSIELVNDQERIKEAYRREGYADARVWPSASPTEAGLGDPAMVASVLALDTKKELYVRYTIEEGPPTLLSRIVVQAEGKSVIDDQLCKDVVRELARMIDRPLTVKPSAPDKCAATIADLKYKGDSIAVTRDRLRDYLFNTGRARAGVELAINPLGPQRVEGRYTIKTAAKLRLGRIIVRGNFKTRESVIRNELRLEPGQLLTSDALAEAARRLRNTGLFETVNIDMPDLECGRDRQCTSEVINAVVRVEERYVDTAEITLETGYTVLNGAFVRSTWGQRNIFGRGIVFEVAGTLGTQLQDLEGKFRVPRWLVNALPEPIQFSTELNVLYRNQDTPRFGKLITQGFGISLSRAWPRQREEKSDGSLVTANTFGLSLDYLFRVRIRNVDAIRPIGSDMDEAQVAVPTTTESIGVTWYYDGRVDLRGNLSPLDPKRGAYLQASVAYARPYILGGQDEFVKFSIAASKFWSFIKRYDYPLVVRIDARYDQGIPIGGSVLLPEVERFFAGGDSTVRGYEDERLHHELIQVGVPPLDNVSQIRVIPAGGNNRVLASIDAQMQLWKFFAGATFFDAGLITNKWTSVRDNIQYYDSAPWIDVPDIRPSVGMGLRALTPFGIGALEYAVPLRPQLGDNPRGRIHFYFAARAQF